MRVSTKILVFMIFLNASSTVVQASGLAEDMGISPKPSDTGALEDAQRQSQSVNASSGVGSTLFGLYTEGGMLVQGFVGVLAGGPIMLAGLGIPLWVLTFIFAPAYVISAVDIYYALSGRAV